VGHELPSLQECSLNCSWRSAPNASACIATQQHALALSDACLAFSKLPPPRIFVHAPSSNAKLIYGAAGAAGERGAPGERWALDPSDPRVRRVPFVTRRPTFSELKRVLMLLGAVMVPREADGQREAEGHAEAGQEGQERGGGEAAAAAAALSAARQQQQQQEERQAVAGSGAAGETAAEEDEAAAATAPPGSGAAKKKAVRGSSGAVWRRRPL
jgi:hypothetical protein